MNGVQRENPDGPGQAPRRARGKGRTVRTPRELCLGRATASNPRRRDQRPKRRPDVAVMHGAYDEIHCVYGMLQSPFVHCAYNITAQCG